MTTTTTDNTVFNEDYDFVTYDNLVHEELYKAIQRAIIDIIKDPETNSTKYEPDVLILTFAAQLGALVKACSVSEEVACFIMNKVATYAHDNLHDMYLQDNQQGDPSPPPPTVNTTGRA